jgi:RHS repeat-associated protein
MATQHDQAGIVAASGPASARYLLHWLLALACAGAAPCAIGQAVPGIPTIGSAVAGDAQATVTFTAPDSDGNSAISIYTATSDPGGTSATSSVNYPGALLHLDGANGSTTFTDVLGHSFSGQGSAAISTAQSRFGSASLALNGTTDYLSSPSVSALTPGANDFTYEAWVYPTGRGSAQAVIFDKQASSSSYSGPIVAIASSTGYLFALATGGSAWDVAISGATVVSLNAWHHVAFVRKASLFTLYLDGVAQGTATASIAQADDGSAQLIGAAWNSGTGSFFPGYIDDVRIGNGVAVYTANFTPPTVALTLVAQASPITVSGLTNGTAYTFTVTATNAIGTGSASTASNSVTPEPATVPGAPTIGTATAGNAQATVAFAAPASNGGSAITRYTATSNPSAITATTTTVDPGALLHFDGTNGSTTFTDVLGHAFSSGNGAALSTANFEFGTASLSLNGSNQSISTPSSADFDLAGDFTIEAWVYYNTVSTSVPQALVSRDNGGGSTNKWGFGLNVLSAGNFSLHRNTTSGTQYNLNWPWSPNASTWYHVAIVRAGNNWTVYVNGASLGTIADANPMPVTSAPLVIGALGEGLWYTNGYIDEVRIASGTAVYTANFTPPAAPLNPVGQMTVNGLTSGTAYTFTVTAANAVGTGPASAASNSVTPTGTITGTTPGAPTIGTAIAGNAQATVHFAAPSSNGSSAITGYTATSSPGGKTGTGSASPITVTGLTNTTAYTFTVTATNAVGTGPESAESNRVTPDVAPTVSISTPSGGASVSAPATFALTASASTGISGESISYVQYYANGVPIGPALTTSPYAYSWSDVVAGSYSLTAIAVDNYGTVGTSSAVSVTVQGSSTATNVYYIYADQVDTPRLIVRSSDNQAVWRWDGADPFGAAQPNGNPAGLGAFVYNPRFPGQLYDQETGTHYNYFRNYDPGIGRYVESDPVGLDGGINTFVYASANPLAEIDPKGLFNPWKWYKCFKYRDDLDKAIRKCRDQCYKGSDEDQIKFSDEYGGGGSLEAAVFNCAKRAAPGAIQGLIKDCGEAGLEDFFPRPRRP